MNSREQVRENGSMRRRLTMFIILACVILLPATPAAAQWIPCLNDPGKPEQSPDLPRIPELASKGGVLHATVVLVDEEQRMTFRDPASIKQGDAGTATKCAKQYVRVFKGIGATPEPPKNGTANPDPMPGPTLRVKVGERVELTFLNHVNTANFPDSIDRGAFKTGTGCDETTIGYPGSDTYPNCFHGSSSANLHFHGAHTSPSSTADNVFIEIRPSPRKGGQATVTEALVAPVFDKFFKDCAARLALSPLYQWPRTWSDLPLGYTGYPNSTPGNPIQQKGLLEAYDMTPDIKPLWPVNQRQLEQGLWPQYYIGAYPFCFVLPEYKGTEYPPSASAAVVHTPQSHGEGTAEQQAGGDDVPAGPVMMGQAPGTHWYHAHKHGSTAINISNGMTGAFIVEGLYDKELDGFYKEDGWTRRQPVMVINQLGVAPNLERGGAGRQARGPSLSVNGRLNPKVKMRPGEVQLWRILNTSARAAIYFPPGPAGFVRMQLSQDGVQFDAKPYADSKDLAFMLVSGNRADILIKAPTQKGLYPVIVKNVINPAQVTSAPDITLFTVEVADATSPNPPPLQTKLLPTDPKEFPLTFPPYLQDIKSSEVIGTKKMVFATTGAQANAPTPPAKSSLHTIDGKQFNGEVGAVVLLNTVEEWQIFNATTNIEHPFHIHINPFQVTEVMDPTVKLQGTTTPKYVTDKKAITVRDRQCYLDPNQPQDPPVMIPDASKPDETRPCDVFKTPQPRIWWDVFPIPVGLAATDKDGKSVIIPGYFKMRSRFVDYPGYFAVHCHILAHEDRGMMTVIEVAPLSSPYSHH
ncbi:MAG: multicopper oxidase domain-containing protein [Acidobacteriota bacterium]|nr:multicopper oxidase domain-containing protein [Acidobacteriota bacterium]